MTPLTRRLAVGLAACSAACGASAYTVQIDSAERLSAWLARQPNLAAADLLGLSWRSAAEVSAQTSQRQTLVQGLKPYWPELAEQVSRLPATGRVLLPKPDARWMLVNPASDPVLQPGDSVQVPAPSEWVAVVQPTGLLCLVRYQPDVAVADYLAACGHLDAADRAWLVQPDGRVFEPTLKSWNERTQAPPAPGAWIWAPERRGTGEDQLSADLARFLATQGPAPGAAERDVLQRRYLQDKPTRAAELRDLPAITNDWGVIGLWQTPTARFDKTGSAALTFSAISPYNNLSASLQPFDALSVAFRYTGITNTPYGSANVNGDQTYKDKSADVKLRLLQETAWLPQVALGWRDILGTGIFSGEYVVANKRFGAFDVSLGLGFGYLGARGDVSNPLGLVSERFKTRPATAGAGTGKFTPKAYFRGPTAVFGGVQVHLPWDNWVLKAEYEGNDYQHEFGGTRLRSNSAVNLGVVWRARPWLDLSLAVERGYKAMFALSVHTQLDGMSTPKILDAPAPAVSAQRPAQGADPERTARDIQALTGLQIGSIERQGRRWTAVATNPFLGYVNPLVDRSLAALHRDAPPEADELALRFDQRGQAIGEVVVQRDQWARAKTQLLPPSQRPAALQTTDANEAPVAAERVYAPSASPFSYSFGLTYRQNLGGPDAFVLYQLAVDARAEWRPRADTWLAGIYRVGLLDNYDKFKFTAPSDLPRVRTYLREYAVTSRTSIPNLQLTHMGRLGNSNHYYLAYAGLLESMFAGAGLEYMYRPLNGRVAIGMDANTVQQRTFEQKFSLRDYRVKTGHVTAYWDTGLADLLATVSVGQYLAGDRGVTVDVARAFNNGVTVGVYATKTNVSAAQFGEGSFDKGIYLRIPFDAMLPKSGPSTALIVYNPLIRDGGAKLSRRFNLYELTGLRDRRTLTMGEAPAP